MKKDKNEGIKNLKKILFIISLIFIIVFIFLFLRENSLIKEVEDVNAEYWKITHQYSYEDKKIKDNQYSKNDDYDGMNIQGIMMDVAKYIGHNNFKNEKYVNKDTVITDFKNEYAKKTHMYIYLIIGIVLMISTFIIKNNKEKGE